MWPLLIPCIVAPTVALRLVFIAREKARRAGGITGPILPPIWQLCCAGDFCC